MATSRRLLRRLAGVAILGALLAAVPASLVLAAGPPFPDPVPGVAVYDEAEIFRPETEATAEAMIDAIEARTGAEVVVYSQVVEWSITTEQAEGHAIALMDQWGVGRAGFDDGLVILFDVDQSLVHGQVQLYAGPGYRETYLTNNERQRIFDEVMLPYLRDENLDAALLAGLREIDAATTPENAARLQTARQVDAVIGLIAAPVVFVGLVLWAVRGWATTGRDPELADSESILVPAPPPGLTPATAALLLDGVDSRRTLTTAMIDLASRGMISFREEKGFLGLSRKVGIDLDGAVGTDAADEYERQRASRQPLGPAEQYAFGKLAGVAGADDYLSPDEMLEYGKSVEKFGEKLERHAAQQGWFREPPGKATKRWVTRGSIIAVVGGAGIVMGLNIPSNGILLAGIAGLAAGIVLVGIARAMPARTKAGVLLLIQLRAYRRTLERTLRQARSMEQVVAESQLGWLETPDRAVVWSVALGLADEVEQVLRRSVEDLRAGRAEHAYVPGWYSSGSSTSSGGWSTGSSLMSSSAVPSFGGMMAALSTIGNTPSSSGDGGGFGGGSSGGGGGGAGGGF